MSCRVEKSDTKSTGEEDVPPLNFQATPEPLTSQPSEVPVTFSAVPPPSPRTVLMGLTVDCPKFTLAGLKVPAKVVSVKDGDTIEVCFSLNNMSPKKWSIRMLGYDSCEVHTRNLHEKLHGIATTLMLEERILNKIVEVQFEESDKYGRWLATIFYEGVDINQWVIDNSPSIPYTGGKKEKNFRYDCDSAVYLKHLVPAQEILDSKRKPIRRAK